MKSQKTQLIFLAKKLGLVRAKDLEKHGISRETLKRLHEEGGIDKIGRGLYMLPEKDLGGHQTLLEACKMIPNGIICLLSALRFHEISTQSPSEIWIALDNHYPIPRIKSIKIRVHRFSGKALNEGIEDHTIKGIKMKIYNPSKTIADCFKFRNKVGLDVCIEALRDAWENKKVSSESLWKYAKICRVTNVIRPYMEMLA